jgi:hypothetical protein
MVSVFYIIAALSSVLGGLVLIFTIASSSGAPQQAAGAAIAMALAVLPYVFARSIQITNQQSEARQRHLEILAALKVRSSSAISPPPAHEPTQAPRVHIG